jgi:hypothetical protein
MKATTRTPCYHARTNTEQLIGQLNNGSLTEDQLLALISGILSGQEIKVLLGIDNAVEEPWLLPWRPWKQQSWQRWSPV